MQKILAKMHAIMGEANYIQKDKTNTFHNYKYASEKAIKECLHELFVKYKVLFTTSITSENNKMVNTGKSEESLTIISIDYKFYDVESGEFIEGKFCGSGTDKADKGLYKAITGAIKYILTSSFLIPTGDDPEDSDSGERSDNTQSLPANQPVQKTLPAQMTPPITLTKKTCPNCKIEHTGQYPTCYDCYMMKRNGITPKAPEPTSNDDTPPFP